jgi:hypothetical protein
VPVAGSFVKSGITDQKLSLCLSLTLSLSDKTHNDLETLATVFSWECHDHYPLIFANFQSLPIVTTTVPSLGVSKTA